MKTLALRPRKTALRILATALFLMSSTLTGLPESANVDIHQDMDSTARYFVTIAARPSSGWSSLAGHALVIFTSESEASHSSSEEAYGYYADETAGPRPLMYIGFYPGKFLAESTTVSGSAGISSLGQATDFLRIQVDQTGFEGTKKVILDEIKKRTTQFSTEYNGPVPVPGNSSKLYSKVTDNAKFKLVLNDCVGIIEAVGNSLGLNMPERTVFTPGLWPPTRYVRAAITRANDGKLIPGYFHSGSGASNRPPGDIGDVAAALSGKPSTTSGLGEFENASTGYHYAGYLSAGVPYGRGTATLPGKWTYTGDFSAGEPGGSGTIVAANGAELSGRFSNGRAREDGIVTQRWRDGLSNCGNTKNRKADGPGLLEGVDYTYEGQFKDGKPNGHGVLKSGNLVYDAEFQNGKPSRGTLIDGTDYKYKGEMRDYGPNGQGVLSTVGCECKGTFKQGKLVHGTMVFTNGDKYEGDLSEEDGSPNGQGVSTHSNTTIKGNFDHGAPIGQIEFTDSTGGRLNVTFVNGKPEGKAAYTKLDGTTISLTYQGGKVWSAAADRNDARMADRIVGDGKMERIERPKTDTLQIGNGRMTAWDRDGKVLGDRMTHDSINP